MDAGQELEVGRVVATIRAILLVVETENFPVETGPTEIEDEGVEVATEMIVASAADLPGEGKDVREDTRTAVKNFDIQIWYRHLTVKSTLPVYNLN